MSNFSTKSQIHRLQTRCLLSPADVSPRFDGFEVIGTFNPGAVEIGDRIALLIRVAERPTASRKGYLPLPYWDWQRGEVAIDWQRTEAIEMLDPRLVRLKESGQLRLTFLSWLLVAYTKDGLLIDELSEEGFLPANRYETFGVEDARLTRIDDRYYFSYVSVSEHGVTTSLAVTDDFRTFERLGIIFCPDNKDVLLFPERIAGQYVAMHRPNPQGYFSPPEMWLASSPDLVHWGEHQRLLGAEVGWATAKVGGGTPPIATDRGWLTLFHGNVSQRSAVSGQRSAVSGQPVDSGAVGQYAAAALVLDIDQPGRIVGVSAGPVMLAEADFERTGFLPNIVFPTGMVRRGDELLVYYGAADTATGVVRYSLDEMLATLP